MNILVGPRTHVDVPSDPVELKGWIERYAGPAADKDDKPQQFIPPDPRGVPTSHSNPAPVTSRPFADALKSITPAPTPDPAKKLTAGQARILATLGIAHEQFFAARAANPFGRRT